MKRHDAVPVNQMMDAYFEAMGLSDQINQARIKLQWKNTMGPVIAAKTTQLSIKNKVLYVSLSSPALRKELLYQREKLVKSLNQSVGTTVIEDIVFQ
jgi:predicted nucleic acid-binding Zn ribbon protein